MASLKYNRFEGVLVALRLFSFVLVAAQILWACSPRVLRLSPSGTSEEGAPPTEALAASSATTAGDAPGCFYAWATQELPHLGEQLQRELATADSGIRASAYAFGEECRQQNGQTTFLAMETDFRVRIPVRSIADEGALGQWIGRVMVAIEALPVNVIPGSRPGRVEFEFHSNDAESLHLNIEIASYRAEADVLQGANLFEHFRSGP
ncbi:MAG: hypothetical protein V1755_10460 [Chloroflexota bacterium]